MSKYTTFSAAFLAALLASGGTWAGTVDEASDSGFEQDVHQKTPTLADTESCSPPPSASAIAAAGTSVTEFVFASSSWV